MQWLDTREWKLWLFVVFQGPRPSTRERKCQICRTILAPVIHPVYGNSFTNFVYPNAVCFSFKDDDFSPLKHSTYVNISKSNDQPAIVYKTTVHKSVDYGLHNSLAAHKLVSSVSCNVTRPDFASEPVCNNPGKLLKFKVAYDVPSKSEI